MSQSQTTNQDATATVYSQYINEKNDYINNENVQVQDIMNKLSDKTILQVRDLKEQVDSQNANFENQIFKNNNESNESKRVKFEYQQIENEKIKHQNYILYIIFYVLVMILGVVLFYMNTTSLIFQSIVLRVLLVYPFIIYYTEFLIYYIYKYVNSFLSTTKFSNIYIGYY
jgi:hypothetical protein